MIAAIAFRSIDAYAWFVPGVAVSALAALLGGGLGPRLGVPRPLATLLIFSLGIVLSATVTPSREALLGAPGIASGCDLSRIGPAAWSVYASIDDASLNVLLFVPLGLSIGLLPRSRLQAVLVLGAVLLPFGVEVVQLFATRLGRACQSADISDNLLGLVLGLGVGLAASVISRRG